MKIALRRLFRRRSRQIVSIVVVWSLCELLIATSATFAQSHTLTDIVDAYEQMYSTLNTIRMDTTEAREAVPGLRKYYELTGGYEMEPSERVCVLASDGRTFVEERRLTRDITKDGSRISDLNYDEIMEALASVEPSEGGY